MSINKRSYQLLGLLVIVWGSSFLLIDRALLFFTPEQVVGYRLVIGAITMFAIALYYGKSFPRTITPWLHFIVYAVIGNILPYLLIATGQLTITSGMAGLLMAFMPLVTLVLAHIFLPNDKLTRFKILGFIIGISGVLFILGPSINNGNNTLFGILLVLGAACAYAINTIIASRLPSYDPLVSSASVLLVASLLSFFIWPNIFFINFSNVSCSAGVLSSRPCKESMTLIIFEASAYVIVIVCSPNYLEYPVPLAEVFAVLDPHPQVRRLDLRPQSQQTVP